jgi:hypothetical protein
MDDTPRFRKYGMTAAIRSAASSVCLELRNIGLFKVSRRMRLVVGG